jgi:hypothetical protein
MAVLCLLTNTPWPWPTPAEAASARGGFPTLGTEWRGRSEAEVCTSEARKIRVPLARARGGASQEGLVSLLGAERMRSHFVFAVAMGPALRAGTGPFEVGDGRRQFFAGCSREETSFRLLGRFALALTLTQHDAESTGNADSPVLGTNLPDGLGHQSLAARSGLRQ